MTSSAVDKIKVWLFPTMVTIIGIFIWQEIKEIKSDVKALLAQSNIDKTRIDNLERYLFNPANASGTTSMTKPIRDNQEPPVPIRLMLTEFILPGKDELLEEGLS